jgi:glycine dehydrogenase
MISIRAEADEIASGKQPRENNVFKNAPHTLESVVSEKWERCVVVFYLAPLFM